MNPTLYEGTESLVPMAVVAIVLWLIVIRMFVSKNPEEEVMDLWVAEDGSYGQTTIVLIDTSGWSIEDWREMEEASDNTRMNVAVDVTDRKGGSYNYA